MEGYLEMKKVLKLLSLVMTGVFTVGCTSSTNTSTQGDNSQSTKEISITVQAEKEWIDYYQRAAERVKNKLPNADIKIIEVGAFSNLDNIDSTDVSNPDVPDVYSIPADRVGSMYKNDFLTPLDAETMAREIGGWEDFKNGLAASFKMDGDYYAFPMNIETLVVFANSINAQSRGIDLNSEIEFTDLSHDDMLVVLWDLWYAVAFMNSVDLNLLSKGNDGSLQSDLTKDFSELTEEQKNLFVALFNYWRSHEDSKTDMWDKSASWSYVDSKFSASSSLRLEGPWSTQTLSELIGDSDQLVVKPISDIVVNGKQLEHWKSGWGLAVNPRIENNKDAMQVAIEMIKELINPKYATDLFKVSGKVLENVTEDAYLKSDLSDIDKETISAVLKSYESSSSRPTFDEWSNVWPTWENAILSWSSVKPSTAQEAYETLQAAFKSMMSNFK